MTGTGSQRMAEDLKLRTAPRARGPGICAARGVEQRRRSGTACSRMSRQIPSRLAGQVNAPKLT